MGGVRRPPFVWMAFAAVLFVFPLLAHEGTEQQILELNRRITAHPGDAGLYLQRGELHRIHRDWTRAKIDYDRAQKLDPSLTVVDFALGRMYLESNQPQKARVCLERYLAVKPGDSAALLMRARSSLRLGRPADSIPDYDAGIAAAEQPSPDVYHERAKVLAGLGRDEEALRGLDEGIARLGSLVSLELQAIEIELRLSHYDGAVARIDRLATNSPRRECFLAERGEILEKAGRAAEAQASYMDALDAIAALPPAHRDNRMTRDLEARIRAALSRQGPVLASGGGGR